MLESELLPVKSSHNSETLSALHLQHHTYILHTERKLSSSLHFLSLASITLSEVTSTSLSFLLTRMLSSDETPSLTKSLHGSLRPFLLKLQE